jgi:deoxyribose-phosphate aldolase
MARDMAGEKLASFIDYTLLKPEATEKDIGDLCRNAKQYGFFSVCVNPFYVELSAELLRDSDVMVCAVVGFPLGAATPEIKALEAKTALEDGAGEIDMVINIGALKSGDFGSVKKDIEGVVTEARKRKAIVKVILETGLLTAVEIAKACELCEQTGADFVKTSTGLGPRGASVEDVKLMKKSCRLKVKASGGIHSLGQVLAMIEVGADRIGTSTGAAILDEFREG